LLKEKTTPQEITNYLFKEATTPQESTNYPTR
jgi:hypothetical protein